MERGSKWLRAPAVSSSSSARVPLLHPPCANLKVRSTVPQRSSFIIGEVVVRSSLIASLALFGAISLHAASASAFCRTTTKPIAPDFSPPPNACWAEGRALYWRSRCVTYALHEPAPGSNPSRVDRAEASRLLKRAFAQWTAPNATCLPGISLIETARTSTDRAEYNVRGPNENVVLFREDTWSHPDATLALTTLTFDAVTGAINDADMEINVKDPLLSLGAGDGGHVALSDVFNHEAGHFLGLSHSGDMSAMMRPRIDTSSFLDGGAPADAAASSVLTWAPDDYNAICAAYPDDDTRTTGAGGSASNERITSTPCALVPGGAPCGEPSVTHGCAAGGGHGEGASWMAFSWVMLSWIKRRARPARARASTERSG